MAPLSLYKVHTSFVKETYGNPSGVNDSGPFTKVRISALSSAGKTFNAPSIKKPVEKNKTLYSGYLKHNCKLKNIHLKCYDRLF